MNQARFATYASIVAGAFALVGQSLPLFGSHGYAAGLIVAVSSGILFTTFFTLGKARGIAAGHELREEMIDALRSAGVALSAAEATMLAQGHVLEQFGFGKMGRCDDCGRVHPLPAKSKPPLVS